MGHFLKLLLKTLSQVNHIYVINKKKVVEKFLYFDKMYLYNKDERINQLKVLIFLKDW